MNQEKTERQGRKDGRPMGAPDRGGVQECSQGSFEDRFHVEVLRVNEFDDEGEVFGLPDQVELDVIIRDGELLIGKIK